MKLVELFAKDEISLELSAMDKNAALREMVTLLDLEPEAEEILYKLLKKRENLGSTGIGKGVAIPHCRSLVVDRLRIVYGRKISGLNFEAVDGKAVHHFFLIVAPPIEVSHQYLPVLGKIAQFCKNPKNLQQLEQIETADEFFDVLNRAEV
jgi:mannitol/fructose-specific phosphotransferase system IIA component (Ntr-type)